MLIGWHMCQTLIQKCSINHTLGLFVKCHVIIKISICARVAPGLPILRTTSILRAEAQKPICLYDVQEIAVRTKIHDMMILSSRGSLIMHKVGLINGYDSRLTHITTTVAVALL